MLKPVEILVAILQKLRSPQGCAWDREQTHESLRGALIEECYELIEAIDKKEDLELLEELGDLLLHIVFHAQIASERDAFSWEDVCRVIVHKMIARHPHVFRPFPTLDGHSEMSDAKSKQEVLSQWEVLKSREKTDRESVLDGVPVSLPALARAQKLQSKASRVGFDWPDDKGARQKVSEELKECDSARKSVDLAAADDNAKLEEEFGDLLFSVVNWARKCGIDAEVALSRASRKFEHRFRLIEAQGISGKSLDEMDEMWRRVKAS